MAEANPLPARDVAQPDTANGPTPAATWGPAAEWGSAAGGKWTLEEVGRFLAEYGRPPARLEARPLAGGWENLNLRVDAAGERFVLRRYDSTDPTEVPWEIELLRYLGERGFPTPAPLPQRDGRLLGTFSGRPAALFPFVEGRHPHWDDPRAADAAADVIARLHVVTAGLALPYPRSRTDVHARLERFRTWVGERENSRHATVLRPLAEEAQRYWAEFSERLECVAAAHGPLPRGVVHSDAHSNNLLFDSEGRLTALLDFDDAREGLLLQDVCMLADTWGVERQQYRFEPRRARRVLDRYTQIRPLTPGERELLPDVLVLHNLADTMGYVTGNVSAGKSADNAVADCSSYARYVERTASTGWRDRLREMV